MATIKNIALPLFAASVIAGTSCRQQQAPQAAASQPYCVPDSMLKKISFDTASSTAVAGQLILSGKIAVNEEKQVKVFPLAGGHVAEVKVALGDYVQAGQELALIRSSDIANYQDEYNAARSQLTIAKKALDVTEDLYNSGLSSEKDYISAQTDYQKALSAFNKITEVLKIYGSKGKESPGAGSAYVIKAPAAGFIVEKNINTGQEVRPDDGNNLFTVSDLKEVWAVANVYESDIEKIKLGYSAEVAALSYSKRTFAGTIDKIANIFNQETKVLNVRIRLQNPSYALKPGMFTRITVRYPENERMVAIPSDDIIFDDNKNWVLRYNDKCNVEILQVSVYKHLDGKTFVSGGNLRENDRVIARDGLYIFSDLKQRL